MAWNLHRDTAFIFHFLQSLSKQKITVQPVLDHMSQDSLPVHRSEALSDARCALIVLSSWRDCSYRTND
jgi:hypothetical protein